MENYEQLLDDAYAKIKPITHSGERFEMPKIEGHLEGTKTVLTNIPQIVSALRRTPEHFQKFMLKELAVSGQREGDRLVLNMNVPSLKISQKIEQYVKEFVLCRECGKPDTELTREDRLSFVKCLACGAKHPITYK